MWSLILGPMSKEGLINQWTPKQTSFMSKKYLPEKKNSFNEDRNSSKFRLKPSEEGGKLVCLKIILNK